MSKTKQQNKRGKYCRTADHRRLMGGLVLVWKPWEQSTGPRTEQDKAKVAKNAFKGGWRDEIKSLRALLRAQDRAITEVV